MSEPLSLSPRISPHKFVAYLSAICFGILCGPLPFHSPGIQKAFGNYELWEDVWSYLLLLSGVVAIIGIFTKHILAGLAIESGGLIGSMFGWLVYSVAILATSGSPVAVLAIALSVASLWQALICRKELKNLSLTPQLPVETILVPVLPNKQSTRK